MRLQLNMPIKSDIVTVKRTKGPLNIGYLAETGEKHHLKSIPVLWGEYGGEASKDDIDTIKQKVLHEYNCFKKELSLGNYGST